MREGRQEGWGSMPNTRDAHYFQKGRSLCGRWLVLRQPDWELNQELGNEATKGTCKACWNKRAKQESKP